jgi:hypothetical protein
MAALGQFIFGGHEGFILVVPEEQKQSSDAATEVGIEYCPFCGTRLEEVPQAQIEKFMRPRRRKRVIKAQVGV